ncbi:MAG: hypothetical protein AB8G23_00965 [Myxococcota bacterium]
MPRPFPSFESDLRLGTLPSPLLELCARLEEANIPTWLQGDGLLSEMHSEKNGAPPQPAWGLDRKPTHSLLCGASGEAVLRALPHAVVTTAHEARITQATTWGPVDLIPLGETSPEEQLARFGLSAFAFAFRPATAGWTEVNNAFQKTRAGELGLALAGDVANGNAFAEAPRRYWIAARLIAEYGLTPTDDLVAAAEQAFPDAFEELPLGASARRMVDRVLASPKPGPGLAFLRASGVTPALFPGASVQNEDLLEHLAPLPAIRWAAWLRGSATQRGLVRLRTPHALSRRVERVQEAHPLDRSVASLREASIRRILNRLEPDELGALLAWRRAELEQSRNSERLGPALLADHAKTEERLAGIEKRIAEIQAAEERSGVVRALALDGAAIMKILDIGPGRQIGQLLAHLAQFIEAHPEKNDREALEEELRDFVARNPEKIR